MPMLCTPLFLTANFITSPHVVNSNNESMIKPTAEDLRGNSKFDRRPFVYQPRRKRIKALITPLLAAITLCLTSEITLGQDARQSDKEPNQVVHFIILIDDSADMRGEHKNVLAAEIPNLLFRGTVNGKPAPSGIPRFEPGRDQASITYFTIHNETGQGCSSQTGKSALPENIFSFQGVRGFASENELGVYLRQELEKPCRFSGKFSPIASAPALALWYLRDQLPQESSHTKTIIIVGTNGRFNTKISPSIELETFRRDWNIKDTETAGEIADKISHLFYFDSNPGWYIPVNGGQDYLLVSDVVPLPYPESVLSYQKSINLDRAAISSERIRLVPQDTASGDLRLLSKGDKSPYNFIPVALDLEFRNSSGGEWRIGNSSFPEKLSIDLTECQPPQCTRNEGVTTVSLFGLKGDGLTITTNDPEPGPGQIDFTVLFRYKTGLYDHMVVKTSRQHIDVTPTPAFTFPGLFYFPRVRINNRELASQWKDDEDRVTSQEEAKNRILGWRTPYMFLLGLLLALIVISIFLYLVRNKYRRPFNPGFNWIPAGEVVVDFNRPAAGRLLVGTVEVINNEAVPSFGHFLKNEEQPTRKGEFSLSHSLFNKRGFKLGGSNPIGFITNDENQGGKNENRLELYTTEQISNGRKISVFLATESILDYKQDPSDIVSDGLSFEIDLTGKVQWRSHDSNPKDSSSLIERFRAWWAVREEGADEIDMRCPLTIKPEESRKPKVTFENDAGPAYFNKGANLLIGQFVFESGADHAFAVPFSWQPYSIQTYKKNQPIAGQPVQLANPKIVVSPGEIKRVPVYLICDGEKISNPEKSDLASRPEASRDFYTFTLKGDFDAQSKPGPNQVVLHRDPTRAEIELAIEFPSPTQEIFWTTDNIPKRIEVADDGSFGEEVIIDDNTITLDQRTFHFKPGEDWPERLLKLRIGNSGKSNDGLVSVHIETKIECEENAALGIFMENDGPLDDLLGVYLDDDEKLSNSAEVKEGFDAERRDVRIHPGRISSIKGAIMSADKLSAVITLNVRIRDDNGRETSRPLLKLLIPIKLEQLPGDMWLCIDFGTSAISAAYGTGAQEGADLIPLQELKNPEGESLAGQDPGNVERGNVYLLPSWIICDSDVRQPATKPSRPGFPGYVPKEPETLSLIPGHADFVSLPATSTQFIDMPDRVIYSLKSWLARTNDISLGTKISFYDNGKAVTKDVLPLEKTVESGFAALAEGYLLTKPVYKAVDQLVLCHPNTFTQRHRDLLREIAFNAFRYRFNIPLQERIRLISESDAVAYYYCLEQMRRRHRSGAERIMVYDFGAGTLDLSLIEVKWKEDVDHPVGWKIKGRNGVPIAGNYLDELLARMVDNFLDDQFLEGKQFINYQYPIVRKPNCPPENKDYRGAIVRLWHEIREAKHKWNGSGPLAIKLASVGTGTSVISTSELAKLNREPRDDQPSLWTDERSIYLSIPALAVHDHPLISSFIHFVTFTVIDELCNGANTKATDIDTVIVSGRGALWPKLREQVWSRFSSKAQKELLSNDTMKVAVVYGAIARQENLWRDEADDEAEWQPKLAVITNNGEKITFEDDWGKPIDLTMSPSFRLVQVNLKDPKPLDDLKPRSLRRYFYVDLTDRAVPRRIVASPTNRVCLRKDDSGGKLKIFVGDAEGRKEVLVFTEPRASNVVTKLPWPVGRNYILEP